MAKRLIYKFTNRRKVRNAIRLLHKNYPGKERLTLGALVHEEHGIVLQVVLQGKVGSIEHGFARGILSGGVPVEMTPEEFANAALEASEVYLGSAALAFPISRPGERPGGGHGR